MRARPISWRASATLTLISEGGPVVGQSRNTLLVVRESKIYRLLFGMIGPKTRYNSEHVQGHCPDSPGHNSRWGVIRGLSPRVLAGAGLLVQTSVDTRVTEKPAHLQQPSHLVIWNDWSIRRSAQKSCPRQHLGGGRTFSADLPCHFCF